MIRRDGFGSEFQTIVCAILCSELHGHEFRYTRPDFSTLYSPSEAEDFENVMNIRGNYPDSQTGDYAVSHRESYPFFESNIDACLASDSMKKIKSLFRAGKNNPFDKNYTHVAVHIRRPSLSSTVDTPEQSGGINVKLITDFSVDQGDRFTNDKHFLDAIDTIRTKHPNALFHIFSQGDPSLFKAFEAPDVMLHLNEPVHETFTMCVFADVLMMSKSSFSYLAALLSDGEIWFTPFWHRPASHWNEIKAH
jgi:hypothetical protein